jgi:hypothetical protein
VSAARCPACDGKGHNNRREPWRATCAVCLGTGRASARGVDARTGRELVAWLASEEGLAAAAAAAAAEEELEREQRRAAELLAWLLEPSDLGAEELLLILAVWTERPPHPAHREVYAAELLRLQVQLTREAPPGSLSPESQRRRSLATTPAAPAAHGADGGADGGRVSR